MISPSYDILYLGYGTVYTIYCIRMYKVQYVEAYDYTVIHNEFRIY